MKETTEGCPPTWRQDTPTVKHVSLNTDELSLEVTDRCLEVDLIATHACRFRSHCSSHFAFKKDKTIVNLEIDCARPWVLEKGNDQLYVGDEPDKRLSASLDHDGHEQHGQPSQLKSMKFCFSHNRFLRRESIEDCRFTKCPYKHELCPDNLFENLRKRVGSRRLARDSGPKRTPAKV